MDNPHPNLVLYQKGSTSIRQSGLKALKMYSGSYRDIGDYRKIFTLPEILKNLGMKSIYDILK